MNKHLIPSGAPVILLIFSIPILTCSHCHTDSVTLDRKTSKYKTIYLLTMNIKMDIIDADIRILIFCFSFKIVKKIQLQKIDKKFRE